MTTKRKHFFSRRCAFFFLAAFLAVIPAFFSGPNTVFVIVLGNYFLVIAAGYWCVAWFSWLRQDGLALLNPGSLARLFRPHADEWKERIPLPGSMDGHTPHPSVDASGSFSAMSGFKVDVASKKTGLPESGRGKTDAEKKETRKFSLDLALAGTAVFLVSLLFQYVIPRIFAP